MHQDKMEKFDFLIGEWNLAYNIPETTFCNAMTDTGTGAFKRMLKDNYVLFEYATQSGSEAKGIFGWDKKTESYRYWWFENSGNFLMATCQFINENILFLNWHAPCCAKLSPGRHRTGSSSKWIIRMKTKLTRIS